MKKILAISLIAMTAVGAANAQIASKQYVDDQVGSVSALVGESSVATQIANAIDQTYDATSSNAQSGTAVAGAIATISGTANSALQSVTANNAAGVVTNIAKDGTAVTMTKAKVTGADIAEDAGIAATQLAPDVRASLDNADTAVQPAAISDMQVKANLVTAMSASSTDTQYPSAKAVYDADKAITDSIGTVPAGSTVMDEINTIAGTADNAVVANSAITGGTHTKITYDEKGLVTAGADLAESDIPALSISKTTGLQSALDAKQDSIGTATGSDGVYVLTGTISGDTVTYKWEQIQRGTNGQ